MENKKKSSSIIRKIIFFVSLIIFIVSLVIILNIFLVEPYTNKSKMDNVREIYYSANANEENKNTFEDLCNLNPDITGWIKIQNTVIDYPVLYPPKNDPLFYLYRDYNKNYTKYGSIFIDSSCDLGNPDLKNIIVHGHSMNDGSMFKSLISFSNLDVYKNSPLIELNLREQKSLWKIIAIIKVNTLPEQGEIFDYLKISFKNDSSFLNYIYQLKLRSLINTPVDINENDNLLTLSTCSYEMKDFRTAVIARKVRDHEDETIDTSLARVNPQPLMPQAYYATHGGIAPQFSTFEEDLAKGKINWYKK